MSDKKKRWPPGKCDTCETEHPPVVKQAQPVTRCECGGKVQFPNREPVKGNANVQRSTSNTQRPTKERPILFSGEMVRAILDGRKTQTRRVVKLPLIDRNGTGCEIAGCEVNSMLGQGHHEICPYGKVGDRLWVRETLIHDLDSGWRFAANKGFPDKWDRWLEVDVDFSYSRPVCPSIHMPRKASRITLEITDVRVERLRDISEADCKAEGVKASRVGDSPAFGVPPAPETMRDSYRTSYVKLWEEINGAGSFAKNPWVWVVTFKLIDAK